jgi:hypothetical protein
MMPDRAERFVQRQGEYLTGIQKYSTQRASANALGRMFAPILIEFDHGLSVEFSGSAMVPCKFRSVLLHIVSGALIPMSKSNRFRIICAAR